MKRRNATRNALFTSIISLLLCVSMLVGTTFAWFTDSVESGVNNIVAGNLDIELYYSKDASTWKSVDSATDLFSGALWEPGHTEVVYLKLSNLGTLALNYQIGINVDSETEGTNVANIPFKLSDYIQFGVVAGQDTKFADRAAAVAAVNGSSKKLNEGYSKASYMDAKTDEYMALVVYMPESVGNEANYRGTTAPTIDLGINVVATQKTQESDSFGPDYDVLAQGATISVPAPANGEDIVLTAADGNGSTVNVASFSIPSAAIADSDDNIEISIVPTGLDTNVTVADDEDASTYEITVSNLKADNTTPIKVELQIGTGRTGVKVYHNATEITDATYNSSTGWVTFYTTSFSPYTVVYDATPVVEDEEDEPTESDLPEANVVRSSEYENTELDWGSYGQWSPTEGLDSELEAAYTFSCVDTLEEAKASPYADWYCDFYVMLNEALGENEIFLGGNYGSFGWVGFHNGDLTLDANTEIALLGSVTSNPWTYVDVVQNVGTFICGVGDVDDALTGATFTVMLRLTNPEDENEYYNISTIEYTFATVVYNADELQNAIDNGDSNIVLGGDIDLSQGIVIPGN